MVVISMGMGISVKDGKRMLKSVVNNSMVNSMSCAVNSAVNGMMNTSKYFYYLKYLADLKSHQKTSYKDLKNIQFRRLKDVIDHSYNNVPFYRELFTKENISPDDIKSLDDLQKIPIITKKEIRDNYDKIIANGIDKDKCRMITTTGSTGLPLKIWNDRNAQFHSSVAVYFAFFEAGLRLSDSIVELAGIVENEGRTLIKKKMVSTLDHPDNIIDNLRKYKPDALYSFPSIFKVLSNSIKEELDFPRLIFTHGEMLSEHCRNTISSAFGAEVYNTYGSTEFNRLAFECEEHSGLHMITDYSIIEIIKDGQSLGPGEEGEIVVTGLYNYAMPLIRYRLGDIGILSDEKCSCGRNWPLIKSIQGRSDDFLTLPSGRIISPRTVNIIEYIPGVLEYRTIQEEKDKFLVQVVPGKDYSEDTPKQIEEQIRLGLFGEKIDIKVETVKELPREGRGKLRAVVSKVK
jgi:phenylacetate-CoA ligase